MKTAWDTFMEYLNGRAKTRVYSLFIIWFLIFHLNVIFFALFVDQQYIYEKYNLLKNEYIREYLLKPYTLFFWLSELLKILLALIMTYIMIFIFPNLITKKTYDREIADEYELKLRKVHKEQELADAKARLIAKELDTVVAENTLQSEQKKIELTEAEIWDEEYEDFEHTALFDKFPQIIQSIFTHYGYTRINNTHITFNVDKDILAYASANDLVELDVKNGTILLKPKGKHFVKKYQLEN